jgi:transcription initiation factor TFIID TATA-box-binding protein
VSKSVVKSPYQKCLVFYIEEPKLAILVNESGGIVCTGAKSVAVACNALLELLNDFRIRGIETPKDPQIQVKNIVVSAGLGGYVDLEMSVKKLKRIQYEPKQFPGVVYRMDDPKVVALIFASGKLVLTGAKRENEVHRAVANLETILRDKKLITYSRSN